LFLDIKKPADKGGFGTKAYQIYACATSAQFGKLRHQRFDKLMIAISASLDNQTNIG